MNALSGRVEPGETWRMEHFSYAYVQAIAAAAACDAVCPPADIDSVDFVLKRKTIGTRVRSPQLDVQVKATADDCVGPDEVTFDLQIKNYDELRDTHFAVPRILIVVVMPPNSEDWLEHDETKLAMKRCGYWLSLRGFPQNDNVSSVRVRIPRHQAFHAQALDLIFRRLEGERPWRHR